MSDAVITWSCAFLLWFVCVPLTVVNYLRVRKYKRQAETCRTQLLESAQRLEDMLRNYEARAGVTKE